MKHSHIFEQSTLLRKLNSTPNPKLAILDIDLTLNSDPQTQIKMRDFLERNDYIIAFITSRTLPYVVCYSSMSSLPDIDKEKVMPGITDLAEFDGLKDPDILAEQTGFQIYIRQRDGTYLKDSTYNTLLPEWKNWDNDVRQHLQSIDPQHNLHKIIEPKHIIYPSHRLQVLFPNQTAKNDILSQLEERVGCTIDDSDPGAGIYSMYLFPKKTADVKADAVNHIVMTVKRYVNPEKLKIIIAGDSFSDVEMCFNGASDTQAFSFLPGGSRIAKKILNPDSYADKRYATYWKKLKKLREGIYQFNGRIIFLGDILYPTVKSGYSTYRFLQDFDRDSIPLSHI